MTPFYIQTGAWTLGYTVEAQAPLNNPSPHYFSVTRPGLWLVSWAFRIRVSLANRSNQSHVSSCAELARPTWCSHVAGAIHCCLIHLDGNGGTDGLLASMRLCCC